MKLIDLLIKIDKGEIKEHTFFIRPGIYHSVCGSEVSKYEYIGNNDFMVLFKDKSKKPMDYNILRLALNEEIEIIEDKPKEIDKIVFNYQDNHNQVEINEYLRCSINEVIGKVNYLLKKEENKE